MKVDRINYSKLLPTGIYSNERIGLEAELEKGDDAMKCLNDLRGMVESLHKEHCPQYYQGETLPLYPVKTEPTPEQEIVDEYIRAIKAAGNKITLGWYEKQIAPYTQKYPQLIEEYNKKMGSFK